MFNYQDHYARVCGRRLELHLYDLSRILACVCMVVLPMTIFNYVTISNGPVWYAFAYFPTTFHSIALTCAWHCNCLALGSASEKMAEDFAVCMSLVATLAATRSVMRWRGGSRDAWTGGGKVTSRSGGASPTSRLGIGGNRLPWVRGR